MCHICPKTCTHSFRKTTIPLFCQYITVTEVGSLLSKIQSHVSAHATIFWKDKCKKRSLIRYQQTYFLFPPGNPHALVK